MIAEEHPDPLTEAAQIAVRDARRFVNLLAAAGRIIVRHQVVGKRVREERDRQARRAMQASLKAERAAARARWAPGNDPQWLRDAGLLNVAEVWAAALPYADHGGELFEKSAESAVLNSEGSLRHLHPYAMSRYDRLRADGMGPVEAMYEALPLFTRPARAYERTAQARSALEPGTGHGFEWVSVVHGPTRADLEAERQRERGVRILDGIQRRAFREGAVPLDQDEQRLTLEATTSLTPRQIATTVRPAPAASAQRRPWRQDFPFPIHDVLAVAAAAKERGQAAPASQVRPRQPEARQSRQ
jgi:hypothetical protein